MLIHKAAAPFEGQLWPALCCPAPSSVVSCLSSHKGTIRDASNRAILSRETGWRTAMPYETLLIAVLALPFVGSCVAALLRPNARNAEAWLAGTVALIGLVFVAAAYPQVADGSV